MNTHAAIISQYAKQLKAPTFAGYQSALREAEENGWGYEMFLRKLLETEIHNRQQNHRKYLTKQARFPALKTLDTFECKALPHIEPAYLMRLAECEFVEKREGIICIGNPGTGKTHLSIALGIKACEKGYHVRFYTAAALVNELLEAQENHRLIKVENQIAKADLLIIDELSYLTFSRSSVELLFQVISTRNERSSLIITTNLEFSRWSELFIDPMLTAALIDRMTHNSHVIDMNGPSFRLKQRLQNKDHFAGSSAVTD